MAGAALGTRAGVGAALLAAGGAVLGGLVLLQRRQRRQDAMGHTVLLSSDTDLPSEAAARNALDVSAVLKVSVDSRVREQPIGVDEILAGAKSRMASLCEHPQASSGLVVALECGIVNVGGSTQECWLDVAVAVIRDLETDCESVSLSGGVQLPAELVAEWVEAGGEGTLRAFITAETGCAEDPLRLLTNGAFPRQAMLEAALRVARATLVPPAQLAGRVSALGRALEEDGERGEHPS